MKNILSPTGRVLLISTVFCLLMILVRNWDLAYRENGIYPYFSYLVWNLFLAWVPYWIASFFPFGKNNIIKILGLLAWLIFLPNAPYIITDLVHLRPRAHAPFWFDLMLFVSFAGTGLMLGLLSLKIVLSKIQLASKFQERLFAGASIGLCAYGVYMGRIQRWNSWDLLINPKAIIIENLKIVLQPHNHQEIIGMVLLFSGLLWLSYEMLEAVQKG